MQMYMLLELFIWNQFEFVIAYYQAQFLLNEYFLILLEF